MWSRFSSRSGGAGDAALSPRRHGVEADTGAAGHRSPGVPCARLDYSIPAPPSARLRRREVSSMCRLSIRARGIMAPPNASRAGRCRTFLGAAARRRRSPHALGKSSPAAAVKPRDRPLQKLLVLHRRSLHHPHGTVSAGGEQRSVARQRPAPPGAVGFVRNGRSMAASSGGRGDAGVLAAGVTSRCLSGERSPMSHSWPREVSFMTNEGRISRILAQPVAIIALSSSSRNNSMTLRTPSSPSAANAQA